MGLIGKPGFDIFSDYANFDWSNFVFNLVFCATTATIVSGAMAERTKFLSYCIYSAVISAVIYPIEAHWIWGGGWISQIGFHDFAGSCAIHMVGDIQKGAGEMYRGCNKPFLYSTFHSFLYGAPDSLCFAGCPKHFQL